MSSSLIVCTWKHVQLCMSSSPNNCLKDSFHASLYILRCTGCHSCPSSLDKGVPPTQQPSLWKSRIGQGFPFLLSSFLLLSPPESHSADRPKPSPLLIVQLILRQIFCPFVAQRIFLCVATDLPLLASCSVEAAARTF